MFLISRIHSRKPEGINVTPDTDVVNYGNKKYKWKHKTVKGQ